MLMEEVSDSDNNDGGGNGTNAHAQEANDSTADGGNDNKSNPVVDNYNTVGSALFDPDASTNNYGVLNYPDVSTNNYGVLRNRDTSTDNYSVLNIPDASTNSYGVLNNPEHSYDVLNNLDSTTHSDGLSIKTDNGEASAPPTATSTKTNDVNSSSSGYSVLDAHLFESTGESINNINTNSTLDHSGPTANAYTNCSATHSPTTNLYASMTINTNVTPRSPSYEAEYRRDYTQGGSGDRGRGKVGRGGGSGGASNDGGGYCTHQGAGRGGGYTIFGSTTATTKQSYTTAASSNSPSSPPLMHNNISSSSTGYGNTNDYTTNRYFADATVFASENKGARGRCARSYTC